jgi:hypothetical protein
VKSGQDNEFVSRFPPTIKVSTALPDFLRS